MEGGFDKGGAGLRDIWKTAFQDFFDLVVAHHLPQAIGTKQEIIACLNRFGEPVHLHRILLSQATIDLITVRMAVDFFGGNGANGHEARYQRMIARHLPESFASAIDVCAAIAHVDDISGSFDQQRGSDGCSQINMVFFPVLVNGLIRPMRTIHQRIYQKFLGKLLAVLDGRQYGLHHTVYSQVTRYLATGMTTHTISYDKQGKRHEPSIHSTGAVLS